MADAPDAEVRPVPAEAAEVEPDAPLRTTNSGVGLGFTTFAAPGPGARPLNGVWLELRKEGAFAPRWQLDLTAGLGVTRPQATAEVFQWGLDAGAWTTQAFVDVTEWAGRPTPAVLVPFKFVGAVFAYTGLATTYVAVPVLWAASPFAAVGHGVVGPTVSFHSRPTAPDVYVEAGLGGGFFVHPESERLSSGLGPLLGVGGHLGKQSVAVRTWLSPPGAHTGARDTVLTGSLVIGL